MQRVPLKNCTQCSPRKSSGYDTSLDIYSDFVFTIGGMKMRRWVIANVHADHYPEKSTDFRHNPNCRIHPFLKKRVVFSFRDDLQAVVDQGTQTGI